MRRYRWLGFFLLCVLSGTSWIIPAAANSLPPLEEQGVRYGLLGLCGFLVAGRGALKRDMWRRTGCLAAAAVGLFGVPMLLLAYVEGGVGETTRSALFAMVPVIVVLAVAAGDGTGGEERGARRFLIPALAGLAGLLLLLPFNFSGSVRGRVMLGVVAGVVVLVGVCSVWLYRLLRGVALWETIAVAGLSNAVFLLGCSGLREDVVWRWGGLASVVSVASLADATEVVLIVWLLREMSPIRFSARFLVIPLVTILESYVLVRPEFTVRMLSGTGLLAVGAGVLLFWQAGDEETTLSLR
jgi:hypothetical protein